MADTPEQTLAELKTTDTRLKTHEGPAKKAFDLAMRDMKQAIDNESEDEIQLAQDLVKEAQFKVDQCLHACTNLHELTDRLQEDEAFLKAHRAEIVKVVQHFGPKQKEFAKYAQQLRQLVESARKAESNASKGAADTEADLGTVKNLSNWIANAVKDFNAQRAKIEKDARADPKAKAAEQARLKLIDLLKAIDDAVRDTKPNLQTFLKDHPDADAGMKRELQKVTDLVAEGEGLSKEGNALLKELLQLKQVAAKAPPKAGPIMIAEGELKKSVAPIVGIDPKDGKAIAELGKVLKDTPPEKWADPLGKLAAKYKSRITDGKAMAKKIADLPVVKKQAQQAAA